MKIEYKIERHMGTIMNKDNASIAHAYYTAMAEKKTGDMEQYLQSDVQFVSPLGTMIGSDAVLAAAEKLMQSFKTLTIRAVCGSENQVMVAYDFDFDESIGVVRTASLLMFKDGLIAEVELFFNAAPFQQK